MPALLENRFEDGFVTTSLDQAIDWARSSSLWPLTFGLACCAIEMMATGGPRYDLDRFGAGAFRASPRQADLMIVAGTVNLKMAERVRRLYDLMPDPKFVIAMGACTCGGGPYYKYGYNVVKGVDLVVPVDVYVPGCPPRPEALLEGLMRIQDKVRKMHVITKEKRDEELIPVRTGKVQLPPELATLEAANAAKLAQKEAAKPTKAYTEFTTRSGVLNSISSLARSASEGFREDVGNRVELHEVQEFLGIPSLALRANKSSIDIGLLFNRLGVK